MGFWLRGKDNMRMRTLAGVLRLSAYLRLFAPRPPRADSISLAERLASLPTAGTPVERRVEIRWNRHQIPFIEAETDRDLAVALGLVHAHLRLGQMEMLRRVALGRLSETIGPAGLDIDRTIRILDFGRAVPAIERRLPPETREWLAGFVAGINHHLMRSGAALPHEFALFGLKREPWTVADILTLGRFYAADVIWLVWARLLPARRSRKWRQLWQRIIGMDAAPVPDGGSAAAAAALQALLASSRSESNALAVSALRSATGGAWLAGDPHLGLALPGNWLIVGYRSPSHHAVGLMLPGMPFIAIGRNPWIAWGGTSLHAISSELCDVSDIPEADLEVREETIAVRWSSPRKIRVRACDAGPVLSDSPFFRTGRDRLALHWVGHEASDEIGAMLAVGRARNWDEFKAALDGFAVSGLNMIFADNAGNIGHALAAWVPKDAPAAPEDLIAARKPWSGYLTASSLPSWYNPPAGFAVSANNRPDTDMPVGRLYSPPERWERLTAILSQTPEADFAALARLQQDIVSGPARELAHRFVQIARAGPGRRLPRGSARILSLLETWDGAYSADAQAPAAFEAMLFHFARLFYPRGVLAAYSAAWTLRDLIRQDLQVCDEMRAFPAVRRALKRTAVGLGSRNWGELHRLRLDHPLGLLPGGGQYRYFDLPASGGNETPMKAANALSGGRHAVRFGSNARHISDLSGLDGNSFVLLGGQDGWFGSTTFADQIPLWRQGAYIEVPLQPEKLRSAFPFVTVLAGRDS
jgi:penicillin amidase